MATPDGGGSSARAATELSSSNSEGAGRSSPGPQGPSVMCPWRTSRFHDLECSRYFDCPTHIVERALSDNQGVNDSPIHNENEDEGMDDVGDHSDPGTVSPLSDDDGNGGPARAPSFPPTVSPLAESLTAASHGDISHHSAAGNVMTEEDGRTSLEHAPTDTPSEPTAQRQLGEARDNPIVLEGETPARQDSSERLGMGSLTLDEGNDVDTNGASARTAPANTHTTPTTVSRPSVPPALLSRTSSTSTAQTAAVPPPSVVSQTTARPQIILPRWQPDAEVTYCPICHTQFSIFVRKHHCRKCGRVVCNSCSPHRITIPHQYIVQPPGTPRVLAPRFPSALGGESSFTDFSVLGGGERVRLCNPCVPDPNTAPPQTQAGHARSQSNLFNAPLPDTGERPTSTTRWSSYLGGMTSTNDPQSRTRSVTMQPGAGPPSSSSSRALSNTYYSPSAMENRILSGTPPGVYSRVTSSHDNYQLPVTFNDPRYRSIYNQTMGASASTVAGPSRSSNRRLPPLPHQRSELSQPTQPPNLIPEEDECPVCHRELPPRTLPNFETLRESHISSCITSHSAYSGAPTTPSTADPGGSTDPSNRDLPPLPPPAPRRTGMFPYIATEKDCVDSAECTICLEEFEVGVAMARLECLCRFHRRCISAWWERHPGRCPMHQHDSFGY